MYWTIHCIPIYVTVKVLCYPLCQGNLFSNKDMWPQWTLINCASWNLNKIQLFQLCVCFVNDKPFPAIQDSTNISWRCNVYWVVNNDLVGFYNCFDFQLNCRCQHQETPHPNVQLNAIFNINRILVFDYLRNSPKYMTSSRHVKYQFHCKTENVIFWTTFHTWKWEDCTGICPESCLTIPCQHCSHIYTVNKNVFICSQLLICTTYIYR